jgi:hypothetical protein
MFSKDFLLKVVKEAVVTFVGTAGATFLAFGDGLEKAALVGACVAGVRAVIGVVVKDVTVLGGEKDTPSI